jgi:hypothetical protein
VRLADNVIFVKRNVEKESRTFDAPTPMEMLILKQRHGSGMCGNVDGFFHRAHRQFAPQESWGGPIRYLPGDAYR